MTIIEALKLLNLSFDFKEEDLREAYRNAMKENHPDYHGSSGEYNERAKKINEARDVLKETLKKRNDHQKNVNGIEDARLYYSNLLRSYFLKNKIMRSNKYFSSVIDLHQKYKLNIDKCNSEDELKKMFDSFKAELKLEYQKIVNKYKMDYCIYDFNYSFDFDCPIFDFKAQLDDCLRKYNEFLKNKDLLVINETVDKCKFYSGHDQLKEKVESIRQRAVSELNGGFYDLDLIVKKINNSIDHIFKIYYENQKKYNDLLSKCNKLKISDEGIIKEIQELDNYLTDFNEFDLKYKYILSVIDGKIYKENLDELYQELLNKYYAVLSRVNFSESKDKIKNCNDLMQMIFTNLSYVLWLNNSKVDLTPLHAITFESYDEDKKIVDDFSETVLRAIAPSYNELCNEIKDIKEAFGSLKRGNN